MSALEADVLEAFRLEGARVWAEASQNRSDMAVWIESLGGPILVEVKSISSRDQVVHAQAQLLRYLAERHAVLGLLVLGGNTKGVQLEMTAQPPLVVTMTVDDVDKLSRKRQLTATLIALRNQVIHGVR